ncbi:MAG: voltage-gated chloride channel family protein [Planctomycetota bacterium]|nr:voltage-gated chloride channel family protein [Planctomycetota bacterium]
MPFHWDIRGHLALARHVLRWTLLAAPVAAAIGSACALFLWLLDLATRTREDRPWLLFLLPLAGVLIVLMYRAFGKSSERGNNLIMDEIHEPGAGVPAAMAPLVLVGTIVTHLFGGSAGREGTAVQIGGSFAGQFGRWLRLDAAEVRTLLLVGIAAGFAGVFGTPLAAAVFAMEVITIGQIRYEAVLPCLIAGIVGDWACQAWGIHHTPYHVAVGAVAFEWWTAGKVALAAAAFGLASLLFAEFTHGLHHVWRRLVPWELLRPVVGGAVVIGLVFLLGTRDYIGLGVTSPTGGVSIVSSFQPGGAHALSWWWKILFTAVTLSCGFKGGEVTPLFFVGAALGNTLAGLLGAPVDLFAALGFVAVFAGATNTPLACTILGIELFGSGHVVYLAIACFLAYLCSGHTGIYLSQRVASPKPAGGAIGERTTLREHREKWFSRGRRESGDGKH